MTADKDKVQFTAIVVTYNEEKYLKASLESLKFCNQIIVVDLGSTDSSVDIARKAGVMVLTHPRVPVVEKVREFGVRHAVNDWIIFQDPDEVTPRELAEEVIKTIEKNPRLALIRVPIQFYFKERALDCTIWGEKAKTKLLAAHRQRVRLNPRVHRGYELIEGFEEACIRRTEHNAVEHYWISSYVQMIEKHLRYIKQEGESRYRSGERFSWLKLINNTGRAVTLNLFHLRGLMGGPRGIFLSFFYGWYVFMSMLSLRRYERGLRGGK